MTKKKMSKQKQKQKQRHSTKQVEPGAHKQSTENNQPSESMEDVLGIAEKLKEPREFRSETSVNFGTLKREINEL